ncbi:hypothetical protein [Flaviaesturariibacter amylovorans]
MRNVLMLLFLIRASTSSAQNSVELLGTYRHGGFVGEDITFAGVDSFYYVLWTCTSSNAGRGTCRVREGRLFLQFEYVPDSARLSSKAHLTRTGDLEGFAYVSISACDTSGEPIPFGTVREYGTRYGVQLDADGRSSIKVCPPATLVIGAIARDTVRCTITEAGIFTLQATLLRDQQAYGPITDGRVLEWVLGDVTREAFEVQYAEPWRRVRYFQKVQGRPAARNRK